MYVPFNKLSGLESLVEWIQLKTRELQVLIFLLTVLFDTVTVLLESIDLFSISKGSPFVPLYVATYANILASTAVYSILYIAKHVH